MITRFLYLVQNITLDMFIIAVHYPVWEYKHNAVYCILRYSHIFLTLNKKKVPARHENNPRYIYGTLKYKTDILNDFFLTTA